ncbi:MULTISPECIES: copper chaperone CopZ [Enterococcus]|uniref:copper chaperone CopZ n=1 Tax=Enterococcus TaxID=1350 RepID=UPI00065E2BE2|nr:MULTISPECIES: copper chaperone CopZ [Enterococcus]KAF1301259.1 copper-binding protein [Enterococcus sp. JM9B]
MKQTFAIKGMNCEHCVAKVENGIKELPGIQKVKIQLKKNAGTVKFDEAQISGQQIADKITEVGYPTEVL